MNPNPSKNRQISLENIPETREPLNQSEEIAGDANDLSGSLGPLMEAFPARWQSGKWMVYGIAVKSSTGEIVARVPKYKRERDRNKYDSRGRLKSKLSE